MRACILALQRHRLTTFRSALYAVRLEDERLVKRSTRNHTVSRRFGRLGVDEAHARIGGDLFAVANFETFREETIRRINVSMVRMPHDWQDNSVPDPRKDQQPADDCVVPEVLERTQLDNWRKQLTLIRGEILEIAEQGSQQGLVELQQETVRLAEAIELLEAFLGRKAPH
jgi:hypothetical protein